MSEHNLNPQEVIKDEFSLYTDNVTRQLTDQFDLSTGYSPIYRSSGKQDQEAESYMRRLVGISAHCRQVVGVDFGTLLEFPSEAGYSIPDQAQVSRGIVGLITGSGLQDELELFKVFSQIRKRQGIEAVRFIEHDRVRIYAPTRDLLRYLGVPEKSPSNTMQ